ncbi:nucleotidyltransferase domain-containing protein [Chitinophaga sp. Hz27]|uniref:nucleotidyltransferase domain-containing protein n=1 Tax=Chitinophaga sp. Hz27 TaxID=3347169 RepID=UPI0035DA3619
MEQLLKQVTQYIRHIADPERIILFGSVAAGNNNVYSDIDLLIVIAAPHHRKHLIAAVRSYIHEHSMASDILIMRPSELDAAMKCTDGFISTALKNSRILYEKNSSK